MRLAADHVTREFRQGARTVAAVRDVSLSVDAGAFLALLGPSGSGKSTLLGLLGLLDAPTRGRVLLDGVDAGRLSRRARARLRLERLGFVFQDYSLHPALSALDNVALPALARGLDARAARERAAQLLASMDLDDRVDHRPSALSGGEQQRVALARALVNEPGVLLADEPTGNLDRASGGAVMDLIADARERFGLAVVIVTHDPDVVPADAERARLVDGRLDPGQ